MLNDLELTEKWQGRGEMLPYDPQQVLEANLPGECKDFLLNIGVPTTRYGMTKITHTYPELPRVETVLAPGEYTESEKDLRIFAVEKQVLIDTYSSDTYYCLEEPTGKVFSLFRSATAAPKGYPLFERRFQNSSLAQWAHCILLSDDYQIWCWYRDKQPYPDDFDGAEMEPIDLPDFQEEAFRTLDLMRAVDPEIFSESDAYFKYRKPNHGLPYYTQCDWTFWIVKLVMSGRPD